MNILKVREDIEPLSFTMNDAKVEITSPQIPPWAQAADLDRSALRARGWFP